MQVQVKTYHIGLEMKPAENGRPKLVPVPVVSFLMRLSRIFLAVWLVIIASSHHSGVHAFSAVTITSPPPRSRNTKNTRLSSSSVSTSSSSSSSSPEISLEEHKKTLSEIPCYWKPPWQKSRWHRRIHLEDLRVGQKLQGAIVQELLEGRTGPKLFFDVGIGRTDSEGRWSIVNVMLRIERGKESVTKKRIVRLRKKEFVELWVSRIQLDCARVEVCLDEDSIKKYKSSAPKIPVSSLSKGTEVTGRIVRIVPFGVFVDIGANRLGLLHIKKVRELYGRYVDKEKGLVEAGLERGAKVRLCVDSIDRRRLALDFTEDVKNEAKAELELEAASSTTSISEEETSTSTEGGSSGMSEQELAEWAAFAAVGNGDVVIDTVSQGAQDSSDGIIDDNDEEDEEEDDDEYDDYDEERDIEDSLGLGYY